MAKKPKSIHDIFADMITTLLRAANSVEKEDIYRIDAVLKSKFRPAMKQTAKELYQHVKKQIPDIDTDGERESVKKLRSFGAVHDAKDLRLTTYVQMTTALTHGADGIRQRVSDWLKDKEKVGEEVTVSELKEEIEAELTKEHGLTFDVSGKMVQVEKYAEMLSRTARIETQNVNMLLTALDNGNDLVECSVVPQTCDLCASLQGRIYSISGDNPNYPALYKTAFKNGYSIIHPNCRHQFFPYNPKYHTSAEIAALEKKTKAPWDVKGQSERDREIYARGQAQQRQWNAEMREFAAMQYELGEKSPYTTIGAFRRAARAKETPQKLKEWREQRKHEGKD